MSVSNEFEESASLNNFHKRKFLAEYLEKLNKDIERIESKYPYIITTCLGVAGTILSIPKLENIIDNTWLPWLVLLIIALILILFAYVLMQFRRVAVLRGYCAFVEEEINQFSEPKLYFWNKSFIDRFEKNNIANIIIMALGILTFLGAFKLITIACSSLPDSWELIYRYLLLGVTIVIAYGFSQNDKIRKKAYYFAFYNAHPPKKPLVCLYQGAFKLVKNSGIGTAMVNQKKALQLIERVNIFTVNINDEFDVLHLNIYDPISVFYAWMCKKNKKKIVISAHSTKQDFKNSFVLSNKMASIFEIWIRHFYNMADCILVPSEYSKELLSDSGVKVPMHIVSNGVDKTIFFPTKCLRERVLEKYPIIPESSYCKKIILCAGFPFKRKGVLHVLDFARCAEFSDAVFLWCGNLNRAFLQWEVSIQLMKKKPENMIFLDHIPQNEFANLINICDVYLAPSCEETEGLTVLEALACEKNVVAIDLPAYKALEGDCHLVTAENVKELKKELRKVLDGKQSVLQNQICRVKSVNEIGKLLLDIYEQQIDDS